MSTIRVNNLQNTSTTDGGISIDTSGNVTLPANTKVGTQNLPSAGPLSNRNLIINGAMQVAQRGTLTSVSLNTNTYLTCDRFQISGSSAGVVTTTQDSDAPDGFGSSLKIDVTTADASLASTDGVRLLTRLEGQDLQHIKKGTAEAQQVTLSFWVKSPKTGTHIAELFDVDTSGQRTVSAEYTISTANTWQNVSLTFPADTTGAFDNDNQQSLLIIWWLAAGSDYTSGTLQTDWAAKTDANRAVGQVNCLDDDVNDFHLTGVQLEVGSVATPFEHRSYGDELARCQRYYWNLLLDKAETNMYIGNGTQYSSTTCIMVLHPPVTMRTAPSLDVSDGTGHFSKLAAGSTTNFDTLGISSIISAAAVTAIASVSGTSGHSAVLRVSNDAAKFAFSAEL